MIDWNSSENSAYRAEGREPSAWPTWQGPAMSDAGPNIKTITLSGPMTLYESSDLRDQLRSALHEGRPVRLDLETTGPWDLAGLQLLASAVSSARKFGLPVRFEHVPRVCVEAAERSGLAGWLAERTDSYL